MNVYDFIIKIRNEYINNKDRRSEIQKQILDACNECLSDNILLFEFSYDYDFFKDLCKKMITNEILISKNNIQKINNCIKNIHYFNIFSEDEFIDNMFSHIKEIVKKYDKNIVSEIDFTYNNYIYEPDMIHIKSNYNINIPFFPTYAGKEIKVDEINIEKITKLLVNLYNKNEYNIAVIPKCVKTNLSFNNNEWIFNISTSEDMSESQIMKIFNNYINDCCSFLKEKEFLIDNKIINIDYSNAKLITNQENNLNIRYKKMFN